MNCANEPVICSLLKPSRPRKSVYLAPAEDLLSLEGMDATLAGLLAARGICTRDDLAEQAIHDLKILRDLITSVLPS